MGLMARLAFFALSCRKRAMVSGTIRCSCALARRSTSKSRLSLRDASPSRAVWQMDLKLSSSTSLRSRSSRSSWPSLPA